MEITVKYRCMFTGHEDTVVLTGYFAQAFVGATYKGAMIERLETVDSKSVQILSWSVG